MPTLTSIAFRYLSRHKLRNLFTILTIIIGVALIIGVNVTFDGVIAQYQVTASKSTGNVDITITSLEDTFNQTILQDVLSINGVTNASARLSTQIELVGQNRTITVTGIDSHNDVGFQNLNFSVGSPSKDFTKNGTDIAVYSSLNYSLGQTLQVQFYNVTELYEKNETPPVSSALTKTETYNFTVAATYGGRKVQAYADLTKIQEICNLTGKIDSIDVKISKYDQTDQVVDAINTKIGSTYIVTPIKQDRLASIQETTGGLSLGLQIVSIIALCVSIIVVLNSMYMNIGEKIGEIGILRAIGSSKRQVFWLFFSQSLILGLIGAALGMGAGILLTSLFKHLVNIFAKNIFTAQELSTLFEPTYIPYLAAGAIAGIVTTLVGGILPSVSASRIEIIRSLRPTMRKPGKQRTAIKLIGLGLPFTVFGLMEYLGYIPYNSAFGFLLIYLLIPMIGVVFLAAGIIRLTNRRMGRLLFIFRSSSNVISRNIDRNLLKSTACLTMIGMSLSFLVVIGGVQSGVITGIEDVVKSFVSCDVTVITESNLSQNFSVSIAEAGGGQLIDNVTPALIVPEKTILINNISETKTSVTLIAIDPETYPTVMSMVFSKETPVDVFNRLNYSGTIVLTAPLASSLNVSINDQLQLPTIEKTEVSVTIPNPALSNLTQEQIVQYQALGLDVPTTVNITVPQVEVFYHDFTVVGIAEGAWLRAASFSGIQLAKACYISYNSLNDTYPKHADDATVFFAAARSSQSIEPARQQIENQYGNKYDLEIVSRNQIVSDLKDDIDKIFLTLYIPVLFAALNAVIGVLSIMIMNVNARKREIGILRSQGMSRPQVTTCIVGEVLVLAAIGFIVAFGLGLIFQSIVVTFMNLSGFIMPFKVSVSSIELALIEALAISAFSAAYPAYRASKLDIVNSLRAT